MMALEVLGTGNAFTAVHYNTSFMIHLSPSRKLIIDGPQALFRLLEERKKKPEAIVGALVTHVHGDHVSGLETLILWKRHHQGKKLKLYTSFQVYRELEHGFFRSFSHSFSSDLLRIRQTRFEDYVEFIPLSADRPNTLEEGLSIEIRHNWHPTPTLGLKLRVGSGSIGISGDTCYRPSILTELRKQNRIDSIEYEKLAGNWLWMADVIYHEADHVEGGPHTHERELLALPEKTRAKIRLLHVPDDFVPLGLEVAKEGEKVLFPERGKAHFEFSCGDCGEAKTR